LAAELTSEELTEWAAFYEVEPFGTYAEHLRFASIYALIANIHRKKGARAVRIEDLMPKPPTEDRRAGRQSVEEQKSIFKGIAAWAKKQGLYKTRDQ